MNVPCLALMTCKTAWSALVSARNRQSCSKIVLNVRASVAGSSIGLWPLFPRKFIPSNEDSAAKCNLFLASRRQNG